MSTTFQNLLRRFNKANNEAHIEHSIPHDAVKLMAKPVFSPVGDQIRSRTYLTIHWAWSTKRQPRAQWRNGFTKEAQ